MAKPLVYIASPYTKGDSCINAHCQLKMFNELLDDGIVTPYAPLVSHFSHSVHPRPYNDWIKYDLEMIRVFDACLRINAEHKPMNYFVAKSAGADREVDEFISRGKPVFYNKQDLYSWVEDFKCQTQPNLPKPTLIGFSKSFDLC